MNNPPPSSSSAPIKNHSKHTPLPPKHYSHAYNRHTNTHPKPPSQSLNPLYQSSNPTLYSMPYNTNNINMPIYPMHTQNNLNIPIYPIQTANQMIYSRPIMQMPRQTSNMYYSNPKSKAQLHTVATVPKPSMQSMLKAPNTPNPIKTPKSDNKNTQTNPTVNVTVKNVNVNVTNNTNNIAINNQSKVKFSFNKSANTVNQSKTLTNEETKVRNENPKRNNKHFRKQRNFSSEDEDDFRNNNTHSNSNTKYENESVSSYTSASSSYSYSSMDRSYTRSESIEMTRPNRRRHAHTHSHKIMNKYTHTHRRSQYRDVRHRKRMAHRHSHSRHRNKRERYDRHKHKKHKSESKSNNSGLDKVISDVMDKSTLSDPSPTYPYNVTKPEIEIVRTVHPVKQIKEILCAKNKETSLGIDSNDCGVLTPTPPIKEVTHSKASMGRRNDGNDRGYKDHKHSNRTHRTRKREHRQRYDRDRSRRRDARPRNNNRVYNRHMNTSVKYSNPRKRVSKHRTRVSPSPSLSMTKMNTRNRHKTDTNNESKTVITEKVQNAVSNIHKKNHSHVKHNQIHKISAVYNKITKHHTLTQQINDCRKSSKDKKPKRRRDRDRKRKRERRCSRSHSRSLSLRSHSLDRQRPRRGRTRSISLSCSRSRSRSRSYSYSQSNSYSNRSYSSRSRSRNSHSSRIKNAKRSSVKTAPNAKTVLAPPTTINTAPTLTQTQPMIQAQPMTHNKIIQTHFVQNLQSVFRPIIIDDKCSSTPVLNSANKCNASIQTKSSVLGNKNKALKPMFGKFLKGNGEDYKVMNAIWKRVNESFKPYSNGNVSVSKVMRQRVFMILCREYLRIRSHPLRECDVSVEEFLAFGMRHKVFDKLCKIKMQNFEIFRANVKKSIESKCEMKIEKYKKGKLGKKILKINQSNKKEKAKYKYIYEPPNP